MFLVFRITKHISPQNATLARHFNDHVRNAIVSSNLYMKCSPNTSLKPQFVNIFLFGSGSIDNTIKFMSKLSSLYKSKIQKKLWFFSRLVECNRKPASSIITKIWQKRRKLRKNQSVTCKYQLESTFDELMYDTTPLDGLQLNDPSILSLSCADIVSMKSYRDALISSTLELQGNKKLRYTFTIVCF